MVAFVLLFSYFTDMNVFTTLFGSAARVKVLRLFVLSPENEFSRSDVAYYLKISAEQASSQINSLKRINLIKSGKGEDGKTVWFVNNDFPYIHALRDLLEASVAEVADTLPSRLTGIGGIRLLVVSGVFTGAAESNIDILVVGDRIKQVALEQKLRLIEAEIGVELRYGLYTEEDYIARRSTYDRIIRDVFDFPHRELVNRLHTTA